MFDSNSLKPVTASVTYFMARFSSVSHNPSPSVSRSWPSLVRFRVNAPWVALWFIGSEKVVANYNVMGVAKARLAGEHWFRSGAEVAGLAGGAALLAYIGRRALLAVFTVWAISALAFLVKNQVRPRGLARLGLPCLLTGTGMAFPWAVIRGAPLASRARV